MGNSRILTSLLASLALTNLGAQTETALPKLVVNITIDRLRSDYLDAFLPLYGENGFRRLLKEGRRYPNAQYSFNKTDRASAIASVATGTTPYDNGIVGSYWLDRNTLQPVYCVSDAEQKGLLTTQKLSARNLRVSTIGDELKSATESKALVYGIAPYGDAAILSAGHAADGAFWIDGVTGKWCGTSYYGTLPVWVQAGNASARAQNLKKVVWEPSDEWVGSFNYFLSGGLKKPFRHKFEGAECVDNFKKSGLVNEEVGKMTRACLENSLLGNDDIPDYLAITFYAGNYKDSPINEMPLEIQDTYVRLDKVLGELLETIDKRIGMERSLIVVTSTGVAPEEQDDPGKYRIPTGTFYINRTAALLNMYLSAIYGQGQYVEATYGSELYLNHKLLEQKQLSLRDISERARSFLIQTGGVKNVFTSEQLQQGGVLELNALHNAYNPNCSGDILVQVSPGWRLVNENTRLNQLVRASYVPFPIFFMGCNVPAATIDTPVSVECIAPTLAKAIRIRAPNACTTAPIPGIR